MNPKAALCNNERRIMYVDNRCCDFNRLWSCRRTSLTGAKTNIWANHNTATEAINVKRLAIHIVLHNVNKHNKDKDILTRQGRTWDILGLWIAHRLASWDVVAGIPQDVNAIVVLPCIYYRQTCHTKQETITCGLFILNKSEMFGWHLWIHQTRAIRKSETNEPIAIPEHNV